METGSNKSLFTLIAVVVFGIFLSLSYYLYQDSFKSILADVMVRTSQSTSKKLSYPTEAVIVENGITVKNNYDGTCTITDYNTANGLTVVIPNSIGGLVVTTIGGKAFYNKGLTSITLPSTLTKIEDGHQEYVDPSLGYEFNEIAWGSFMKNNLTSITIPSSVTYIGNVAFSGNKLTSLTLPTNLTYLGHRAFSVNQITSVTIPSGIKNIYDFTFARNQLTSVVLNQGLLTIGNGAFNTNLLTTMNIPSTVTNNVAPAFNEPIVLTYN